MSPAAPGGGGIVGRDPGATYSPAAIAAATASPSRGRVLAEAKRLPTREEMLECIDASLEVIQADKGPPGAAPASALPQHRLGQLAEMKPRVGHGGGGREDRLRTTVGAGAPGCARWWRLLAGLARLLMLCMLCGPSTRERLRWIKVCRGLDEDDDAHDDEEHVVFLGQGAQEATRVEAAATAGAVATPQGRWYKGWRRVRTWSGADLGVLQFEALGRTDGLIDLDPSEPPANSPYCDTLPNRPFKDGVQAHPGNANWTTNGMSVGCTTVSPVTGGTSQAPATVRGNLRSISATFGADADGLTTFTNKQTRRENQTADALISDDHGQPVLDQPDGLGEPVHMQRTAQQAIFGGFQAHEIPRSDAVDDEPTNRTRIRLWLQDAAPGTLYYQYHHAVVFGHESIARPGGSYQLTVWVPVKVIRGWNCNRRNLLVRGRCQIAWYVERRRDGEAPVTMAGIEPNSANSQTFGALANVGRLRHTWTPTAALETGQDVSVLRYRVELPPSGDQHNWEPEAAMTDLFSAGNATLAEENETTIDNVNYLEGVSELVLVTMP